MFIRYMADKAYEVTKSDTRKPRKVVTYGDLGKTPGIQASQRQI